ncbi:chaplin [Streptomyces sp. NPDC088400]|uniref:chaplin n=1 Tax=Streptomyces sp. NPDC088400 TaxID=3365861 RepID=UPI0038129F74
MRIRTSLAAAALAASAVLAGAGSAVADADADAIVANSPGVLSGNNIQVPIHIPVNVCGNTINIIALLNPTTGNVCINADGGGHAKKGHGHHGG